MSAVEVMAKAADLLLGCPDDEVAAEAALALCHAGDAVMQLEKAGAEVLRCLRSQGVSEPEFEGAIEWLDAALGRMATEGPV